MKLIKELTGWNGLAELYRHGDDYYVVSTVTDKDRPTDAVAKAYVQMVEELSSVHSPDQILPSSGEETIAFFANAKGEVTEFEPHAVMAIGENSRAHVLDQLKERPR